MNTKMLSKTLSILITFAMLLALLPGGFIASADDDEPYYESFVSTRLTGFAAWGAISKTADPPVGMTMGNGGKITNNETGVLTLSPRRAESGNVFTAISPLAYGSLDASVTELAGNPFSLSYYDVDLSVYDGIRMQLNSKNITQNITLTIGAYGTDHDFTASVKFKYAEREANNNVYVFFAIPEDEEERGKYKYFVNDADPEVGITEEQLAEINYISVDLGRTTVGTGFLTMSDLACFSTGIRSYKGVCGDNLVWEIDEVGNLTISGTGDMTDYTYSRIAPWKNKSFTKVIINSGVTSIGECAFYGCTGLTSVTIPDSVTSIGGGAFGDCTGLKSITIPDSVEYIGSWAFEDCTSLTSVTIGNGVTSIGYGAFYGCTGLKSVTIPDDVTIIEGSLFSYCYGLTSVTIGNGVTSIGYQAFYGCSGLTSVTIPDSVTSISVSAFDNTGYYNDESNWENGVLYIGKWLIKAKTDISGAYSIKDGTVGIAERAFRGCAGLTSVTIPNSVTSIGWEAFYYCTGLTSIDIPDSVTSIGGSAFYGCTGLTSVTIGNGVTSIGYEAFYGCTGLMSVTIPDSVTSIGDYAFRNCTGLTSVTIPDIAAWCAIKFNYSFSNPLFYAHYLYLNGKLVTDLVIPDGVTSIGECAFYGCTGLTSVTIPDSVTSIGGGAFGDCTGLTSVTIGNSVTSIGDGAFRGCTGLTSITIPDSVTSIGSWAFSGCTGLTNITVAKDNPVYHSAGNCLIETAARELVLGCKNSVIPADGSVTSIGDFAFSSCTGLTSVTIPNSVTSIGYAAFSGCTGLTSITIPNSVTSIGEEAFYGCIGLTSVTIGNSVKSIDRRAFLNCTGLTDVMIPDSVTSIGDYAFAGCTGLTSVMIPDSVEYIESWAFEGCTGLTSVTIGNSVKSIDQGAFYDCTGLTSVTIPGSVTSIARRAFHYYDRDTGEYKPLDVTLRVYKNSYAHQYAIDNGCDYRVIDDITGIAVTTLPAKTTYFKYKESLDVTGGRITLYYGEGDPEVIDMTADMVSGFDNSKLGTQTLTVTYDGRTATFNVNVVEKTLESIAVTTLPEKTEYQKGEALDVTGGKITLYYSDGSSATINMSASMVSGFDSTKAGEQTLRVTFGGKTATFDVTIVGSPVAKGDADGDAEITVADALIALRIAAKLVQPTDEDLAACDTDGDGEITVADALKILRVAAKLVDSL